MANAKLKASKRKIFGRKVKQLRKAGKIPANIFGPKTKSQAVTIEKTDLLSIFEKAGETALVDLTLEGEKEVRPVLITNLHLDPVTNEVLHADLHQVDLTAKTTADIPIVTVGESPAAEAGNIVVMLMNEVEVEALPADLPEKFELDLSTLEKIGDTIHIKDIKVDEDKVKILAEGEEPVVTIQEPEEEEEPEPVEEEAEEGEEGKEGEAPEGKEGEKEGEEGKEEGKGDGKEEAKEEKKEKDE